jgi:hypothetical protein
MGARKYTPTKVVYRVQVHRPEFNDSRITWTTAGLIELRRRYGDNIMSVQKFVYEGDIYGPR